MQLAGISSVPTHNTNSQLITVFGSIVPMPDLDLTILMPCLNEAETLAICVRQAVSAICDANVSGEVLVADNGSTDGSQAIAIAEGARVVDVPTRGYGAALIAGIEAARGKYIMMADADASYHFEHLPRFLPKLDAGYDLVMGNRFAGVIEPGAMPPLHRFLGNPVLSAIGRIFFRIPVRDFHCGLRAFRRDAILSLNLRTTGMESVSYTHLPTGSSAASSSEPAPGSMARAASTATSIIATIRAMATMDRCPTVALSRLPTSRATRPATARAT